MYVFIGILLLTLGRKLFWLFVALVGLAAGFRWAESYWVGQPYWMVLLAGLSGALIGALLALFFQRLAIGLAGFAAGGLVALHLVARLGWERPVAACIVGGVLGAIVLFLLFDWGLIVLSSVAGATLVVQALNRPAWQEALLLAVLILAGVTVQGRLLVARKNPFS